jgi:hypothetical protein
MPSDILGAARTLVKMPKMTPPIRKIRVLSHFSPLTELEHLFYNLPN